MKHRYYLLLFIIIAVIIRVALPFDKVFTSYGVMVLENDPWFYTRLTEYTIHNFPDRIWFDTLTGYPQGNHTHFGSFVTYVGAMACMLLGATTLNEVNTVLAFIPVIGGAIAVVVTYYIARELYGDRAGLLAGIVIATMAGQFMYRSMLGFNDHHIWEVVWVGVIVYALIKSFDNKNYLYLFFVSALGYLATWEYGYAIFGVLTLAYLVINYVGAWREGVGRTDKVVMTIIIILLTIFVVIVAFTKSSVLIPSGSALAVGEVQPITFNLNTWYFGVTYFFAVTGVFYTLWRYYIEKDDRLLMALMWIGFFIIATFGQNRFAYYLAVPVAVFSSIILSKLYELFTVNKHLVTALILLVVIAPNLFLAVSLPVRSHDEETYDALTYLRENGGNPMLYDSIYYHNSSMPAYSVMSWWDYGHVIEVIGHRAPVSNPFQQQASVSADYFVGGNKSILHSHDVRYVIVTDEMVTEMFMGMAVWHYGFDEAVNKFYSEGELNNNYTESLVVKLWNEDGGEDLKLIYKNDGAKVYRV